jgi:hypothetical protein
VSLIDEQRNALFKLGERAELGGEVEGIGIVLRKAAAEDFVERIEEQHIGFALFENAERGIDAGFRGMGAEEGGAERMDGADTGGVDFAQEALPGGAIVTRKCCIVELLVARSADATTHFACGGIGESDRDELAKCDWGPAIRAGWIEVGEKA